ncbi:ATP-dependent DNA helicase [Elysia marginata]|uniref:ATP-dependent DNA helicase n=1 Tax=Elysia marginata TaxID=1093978 RepID=A0AAV4FW76_9GAST|nr:ATP-dependent DNA helicase [Elysia marginata]
MHVPRQLEMFPRSRPSHHFEVLLLNVQSSRKNSTLLNDLIEQSNTDVAFFVETWLRPTGDEKPPSKERTVVTRSKDIDHAKLSIDLSTKVQEIPIDSACDKVEAFNAIMTNILDKHAPLKSRTVTDKPAAPWRTATIKEAKAERRRAERTWKASKLTVHMDILSNVIAKLRT